MAGVGRNLASVLSSNRDAAQIWHSGWRRVNETSPLLFTVVSKMSALVSVR
jgi:hypothetical protein